MRQDMNSEDAERFLVEWLRNPAQRSRRYSSYGYDLYLPNVIISPHNSSGISGSLGRAFDFFCDNLSRYLKSEPMQNVIDPHKGY